MSRLSVLFLAAWMSNTAVLAQTRNARSVPAANRLVATDDSGNFALDNLPPGDEGVVVAVLGHSSSLPAANVAGLEVYRNTFDVPLPLQEGLFNGATLGTCGAIAVWTRDWRSNLPADW